MDGSHWSCGIKTRTLGGDYESLGNTAYSASVKTLGGLLGIKGTLSPTALWSCVLEVLSVGSVVMLLIVLDVRACNGAMPVGSNYKSGHCGMANRSSNSGEDGFRAGESAGVLY